MSAARRSAPRRAAAKPAPEPAAEASESPEAEPAAEASEDVVPLNRAERRGRAKKGANPPVPGRGKVVGRSVGVQGPRLYSNRRGGS